MGFFDLKFIIIILLTIIVYLMYREIISIKFKVEKLYQTNNDKITNDDKKIIKDNPKNKSIINNIKNQILDNLEISKLNNNEDTSFVSKCIVKTIKIPLDLETILNPFQKEYNSPQIIELSPSNIEEITSPNKTEKKISPNNIEEITSSNNSEKPNSPTNNKKPNSPNQEKKDLNQITISLGNEKLETIEEENQITDNNETTEINTENKSYASSSHIEIYSNNESNVDSSIKLNICENSPNESNIDYKNILKNLSKYKLPELQDIAIQFKLPKENNNKKKTRLELIEEIKNYISNKNI